MSTRRLWADLRGVYIIWYRDVLRFWRDRPRIIASLAQPALYLFIFGSGLSSSFGGGGAGGFSGSYVQFIFPGVVGMALLFTSIFSALSIAWDREFGFLKEVLVAPLSRSAVAIGKALGGSTQAVLQGGIVLVMAPLVDVTLTPLVVIQVIPLMFLLAFSLTSLGIALASRLKSMEGFQVVMQFLMMPMFFLSGALFPLVGIPDWLKVLAHLDPVTYGIDPIRRVILSASSVSAAQAVAGVEIFGRTLTIAEEIVILAVFAALMLAFAVRAFAVQE
ncbi:MAG: ABC transporter [Chloroflexota bacterium]|nr:MAG: ABC transporter [Chloroflexota bacterium]